MLFLINILSYFLLYFYLVKVYRNYLIMFRIIYRFDFYYL